MKTSFSSLAFATLCTSLLPASVLMIDDFSYSHDMTSPGTTTALLDTPFVVGGEVDIIHGDSMSAVQYDGRTHTSGSSFHASSPSVTGTAGYGRVFLTYDGNDSTTSNSYSDLSLDLSGYSDLRLVVSALNSTGGSVGSPRVVVTLRNSTTSSMITNFEVASTGVLLIPFDTFSRSLGFDLSNVTNLQIFLDLEDSEFISLDSVSFVPEPSSALLGALGLLPLLRRRRG